MEEIRAPWTKEQVDALNAFQRRGQFHPFTCGSPQHLYTTPALIAEEDGWHCSLEGCGYRQNWALAFMAAAAWGPPPPS